MATDQCGGSAEQGQDAGAQMWPVTVHWVQWPWEENSLGLILAGTTQETPEHVGAPPPCPCIADPPQRAEVDGQWSQTVLAADWPGEIPPIDLPTAIKAQLQRSVTQLTQKAHFKYTAWVKVEAVPLDPTGHLLH